MGLQATQESRATRQRCSRGGLIPGRHSDARSGQMMASLSKSNARYLFISLSLLARLLWLPLVTSRAR